MEEVGPDLRQAFLRFSRGRVRRGRSGDAAILAPHFGENLRGRRQSLRDADVLRRPAVGRGAARFTCLRRIRRRGGWLPFEPTYALYREAIRERVVCFADTVQKLPRRRVP